MAPRKGARHPVARALLALLVGAPSCVAHGAVHVKSVHSAASQALRSFAGAAGEGKAVDRGRGGERGASNAELDRRISSLSEVERDLLDTKTEENAELKRVEGQIVTLVHRRDVLKRGEARRVRDITFLRVEELLIKRRMRTKTQGASSAASGAKLGAGADSAQAAAANATVADVAATRGQAVSTDAADAAAADAEADAVAASAEQAQVDLRQADGAAAATAGRAEALRRSAGAEREARRLADDERSRAEAVAEEARQKKDAMADSADDSFKQFMKEEDGEDQMGDAAYEDSANALAGAIGWNRKDIESKADNAVKQLTQAIGGRKVIQSVQGLMAGIR